MVTLAIGTSVANKSATKQLAEYLKTGGLEIETKNLGQWVFLGCKLKGTEKANLLYAFVADAVADLLVGSHQRQLLGKILRRNYKGFTVKEQEEIIDRSLQILNCDLQTGEEDEMRKRQRKNLVYVRLLECLAGRPQIVLEGFVRFRLKEYYRELKLAVDLAVEEQLAEREYKDFISLLRSFVEIQPSSFELLHVVHRGNSYRILDEKGQELSEEFLEEPLGGMEPEDILLSNLITLAPKKLVLHGSLESEISRTIEQVFSEQVTICSGCELCR